MKCALLLVDLQEDYLAISGLQPPAGEITERAAALLEGCRAAEFPAIHVWTTVSRNDDRRMPHWKRMNRWLCVEGTSGHRPPEALRPAPGEAVVHKKFFSGFSSGDLDSVLAPLAPDTLIIAGIYTQGCVRSTALDAYERGYATWIASDAIGSEDPLHAAITSRYLETRCARFLPVDRILAELSPSEAGWAATGKACAPHRLAAAIVGGSPLAESDLPGIVWKSPLDERPIFAVPVCGDDQARDACRAAQTALPEWRNVSLEERRRAFGRLARALEAESGNIASELAREIGKPVGHGHVELARGVEYLRRMAGSAGAEIQQTGRSHWIQRRRPIGVMAAITPWNNPVSIPLGKIIPALLFGNAVVWKPAPAGSAVAIRLMGMMEEAGIPPGIVNLVCGDESTAGCLMGCPEVAAVSLTGGPAAGFAAQEICARRFIPLQAELGGNNAAVVWQDADLPAAARAIASSAFGFAGQRCTANRRAIVHAACHDRFVQLLEEDTSLLAWGDPLDEATSVGPMISTQARRRVLGILSRALAAGMLSRAPHSEAAPRSHPMASTGITPTIVLCDNPLAEVAQEESFGPILVVQRAADWEEAMRLCNGVRQGLIAALFSQSQELGARFLNEAQAGMVKLNAATTEVSLEAPFGGWKASGIGPPEYGGLEREFHSRVQAAYLGG